MMKIDYEGWEYLEDWRVDYFVCKTEKPEEWWVEVRSKGEGEKIIIEVEGVRTDEEMERVLLAWVVVRRQQRGRAEAED